MKNDYLRRISLAFIMTFVCATVSYAYDFEVDSIYYNITSESDYEVEVTYSRKYKGNIVIPESVTYNEITYSVTSIGDEAFQGRNITSIELPNSLVSIGVLVFEGCDGLTSIDFPDGLTSIGYQAFFGCSKLTSVTFNDGLKSIGDMAFYACERLTSIDLPDGLTYLGGGAFSDCYNLTSVNLPDSLTCIDDVVFYSCQSLTSMDVPDGVTSIGDMAFYHCSSLTSIDLPESLTSIGEEAFYSCGLTSIDLPDGLTIIGDRAFYWCSHLTSIDLPDGLTSIGDGTFYGCYGLTSIDLPDGLTSIGEEAFYKCGTNLPTLTSIDLPDGLTSIGYRAFYGCTKLTDIYSQNETPPTCYDSDVFSSSTYSDATLHVPSEALSDYKTASTWKEFYTIVGDVVTGVEDIAITQDYSIRASDGVITVSGVSGTVYVYNINGKKVAEATADGGTTGIRISHHGVYIVKVYDGKSSATQKVII